jgi:hypothetical protein
MHAILLMDLIDELSIRSAAQFILVEQEVVRLTRIVNEVWVLVKKLLNVSRNRHRNGIRVSAWLTRVCFTT